MHGKQLLEHSLELIQAQCVGAIGLRMGGIIVDFEKDPINTCSHRSTCQHWNELRLTA